MGRFPVKLNHKGSTLLMVIICLAFLGILGALMLSVSLLNLQMKTVESKSRNNFYTCENALEEINAGLEELTAATIKETYEEILKNYVIYTALDDNSRNVKIQEKVLAKLLPKFGSSRDEYATVLKLYLSNPGPYKIAVDSVTAEKGALPYSIVLKNVTITYQEDDYKTYITIDLRITLPSFTFQPGSDTVNYSMVQPYEGYALVADGNILSENSTGENMVTGNIYSGKGITVRNTAPALAAVHKLTLNGAFISTRGDIKAQDTASLMIGYASFPILCANNIVTEITPGVKIDDTANTDLKVHAISLLKDDLALNARNSNAVFTGGYVGFCGEHTAKGSAIMINGSGSSLDLSGLSALVLAGRAHISVEDSILSDIHAAEPQINIMTGESLAFKCNQHVYLVPGEDIFLNDGKAAYHNPLTMKDLDKGTPIVDIRDKTGPAATGFDYFDYIKASPDQFKIVAKQTVTGGDTLRYYYLNFASGKLADQYLMDYTTKDSKALQAMENFKLGSVAVPGAGKIFSVGNLMYYTTTESDAIKKVRFLPGKSADYADDAAMDTAVSGLEMKSVFNGLIDDTSILYPKKVSDLSSLTFNITHYLKPIETVRKLQDNDQVVATTVLKSAILPVSAQFPAGYVLKSAGFTYYNSIAGDPLSNMDAAKKSKKSVVIINGDAQIAANSYFNGFLIASGSITIGEGAVVNGIIIAAGNSSTAGKIEMNKNASVYGRLIASGDIILHENCTVDCTGNTSFDKGLTVNTFLKNLFDLDGQVLWRLFINPEVTININSTNTSLDLVNINKLVSYENWRKNKK